MTTAKTYTYKGKLIKRNPFNFYYVFAYNYDNQFRTLTAAKSFIDRMEARGDLNS